LIWITPMSPIVTMSTLKMESTSMKTPSCVGVLAFASTPTFVASVASVASVAALAEIADALAGAGAGPCAGPSADDDVESDHTRSRDVGVDMWFLYPDAPQKKMRDMR
jgi:hypothetical protein